MVDNDRAWGLPSNSGNSTANGYQPATSRLPLPVDTGGMGASWSIAQSNQNQPSTTQHSPLPPINNTTVAANVPDASHQSSPSQLDQINPFQNISTMGQYTPGRNKFITELIPHGMLILKPLTIIHLRRMVKTAVAIIKALRVIKGCIIKVMLYA